MPSILVVPLLALLELCKASLVMGCCSTRHPEAKAKALLESPGRGLPGRGYRGGQSQCWRIPRSRELSGLTVATGFQGAYLPPIWSASQALAPAFLLLRLLSILVQARQPWPPWWGCTVLLSLLPYWCLHLRGDLHKAASRACATSSGRHCHLGTFHAKMGAITDRNGKALTEAEEIKKR